MSQPDQRTVTEALFEQWSTLDALLSELTEDQWHTPTALPGWTVHDVVSHIIGTESLLLGERAPKTDTDVKELEHVHNDIGAFNERWVLHLRAHSPTEMLQIFREVTGRRREFLSSLTDAQWTEETIGPAGPTTVGGFMLIRLFDCWVHELDIRDAVGMPGDEGGVRGDLSMEVISRAIGFAVGKRAQAPAGSRIVLELTGALARTFNVAVEGRARLIESLDADPTVHLRLDSGLYVRLACGRVNPQDKWDDIESAGDAELGRRIAENLKFTI
ncbi:maleylpyruvate isomerase family mycothiol-dependent enzyme [Hoyosella subflava]|uniref:Mycothiol-dependent maleylpyruvate isomerase metal-binding domain-containing protein n=1 Tax=Hoyosella subflava (strain DSM 45089 / JCM 17490 / NBRC 109087 / DQS3-9A1) TaxID=443218 RepID=F6EGL3_HOYSD|nr:maleylpyruvate isomerase family mycothiol-dependent enzyme [Hoyosella subflava]AEF41066.1 hypothetical protein AS9A_2619 [Hoyosella subflava DQS3-9A1]